ncbi:DUF3570 domain-containing protein [Thalassolituus sp. LLYu03]|uniref:DUF3570 domain-containing protein n=1 Tax=Thalassolituus sp. LLYu03 TaxID=3421656 RepID=UPI003D2B09C4
MSSEKASALLLLAAAQASAMSPPADDSLAYQISQYQEQEMPANRVASGSNQRYQILTHQLAWEKNLTSRWRLSSSASYESMSGASPLQTFTNSNGQGEVLMSGASIDEQRVDASATLTRYFASTSVSGGGYVSSENDYTSTAWNLAVSQELFSAMTTVSAGYSQAHDTLSPTDPELSLNRQAADGETKDRREAYLGVSQILNKYEVLQITAGAAQTQGYLSDPYRNIDRRPDERNSLTLSLLYRFFMKPWGGSAHWNARLYDDDWGVSSQTLELKWLQSLGRSWRIDSSLRLYRQSAADFYSLAATDSGQLQSNDSRLSSFGALTLGLGLYWQMTPATRLSANWSQYVSHEDWGPDASAPEAPAMVQYSLAQFGVFYRY